MYAFLVAIANSIDNIGIRIAYTICGIRVNWVKNLLISFMAFIVAFLSSYTGGVISQYIDEQLCSIMSMVLLVFTGAKLIVSPFTDKDENNICNIKEIGYSEAISVGTALALDDIGGAVGIGLKGYNPFIVGISFFIVSYLIFLTGNYMPKFVKRFNNRNGVNTIAGVIVILIGISQLFT